MSLAMHLSIYKHDIFLICSSAVAATCDALSITSLVARKLLGAPFSLVRKCAGKPLLQILCPLRSQHEC